MTNQHSPAISQALLKLCEKSDRPEWKVAIADCIGAMGPSCFFDQFQEGSAQEEGALKVFEWLQSYVDYDIPDSEA